MTNIIVAFSRPEDGKTIKNALARHGFCVCAVCSSGSQALNCADSLADGIVVCGCRFADMMYGELYDCLPPYFDMVLVASPAHMGGRVPEGVAVLNLPLKVQELLDAVGEAVRAREKQRKQLKSKPRKRSRGQQELIDRAKALLMERRRMTEPEAHRYMQKCAMDGGDSLAETAGKIISLMEERGEGT